MNHNTNVMDYPSDIIKCNQHYTRMWLALIINCILLYLVSFAYAHLPEYAVTPSNKIDQFCSLAETCIHDTIPICGRMGDEKRTFLDLCDLLEYACDTNQIYSHVEDTDGCPVLK